MTNTHINVGGHKITTNKVGTAHTGTLNSTYLDTGSWCTYLVVNGICYIGMYLIAKSGFSDAEVITNIPKSKMDLGMNIPFANSQRGLIYITKNRTTVRVWSGGTGNAYVSFSYPVADDWVES